MTTKIDENYVDKNCLTKIILGTSILLKILKIYLSSNTLKKYSNDEIVSKN